MHVDIQHDNTRRRFFVELDGTEAYLSYRQAGDSVLDYTRTFVPPEFRHHQIGERIVCHALEYARDNGYRVIPTCPFVSWVVGRNPDHADLLVTT